MRPTPLHPKGRPARWTGGLCRPAQQGAELDELAEHGVANRLDISSGKTTTTCILPAASGKIGSSILVADDFR
jgi:hypothetical protein